MSIEEIKIKLIQADTMYYDHDDPIMEDSEYDRLTSEYHSITGKIWNNDKVPGTKSSKFNPFTHLYPVKSLSKVNTEEDLRQQLYKLAPGVVQKKWDGLTLVIYPGNIIVTRGDGYIGETVTHSAKVITEGKEEYGLPIRGEGFFLKSDWEKINSIRVSKGQEPYKNLRNAVAGAIRNLEPDIDVLKHLHFVAYNILGCNHSEDEQLEILQGLGYTTCRDEDYWSFTSDPQQIEDTVKFITNYNRDKLDVEIDGLVVKNNTPNSLARFGQTAHHPNNAVAYKFENTGTWTKLLGIRWTVGRTGKLVPNADIQPVELLNTTVKKASIHNASMLSRKGLKRGCEVFIVKGNDIIPDIVDSRGGTTPFTEPTRCPKCDGVVSKIVSKENEEIYQLYCENADCESKLVLRVVHMAQKDALDIDMLAEETAQKMYDEMFIDCPTDIYSLSVEDFMELEGFAKPKAVKLYKEIQKSRNTTLARFIYACGIPLVGKSKSEDIANALGSYEALIKDIKYGCPIISNIKGIGSEVMFSIHRYSSLLSELRKFVTPKDMTPKATKTTSEQLSIVVTGSFKDENGNKIDRKKIEQLIKDAGHKAVGSVSSKTSYVLVGEAPGSKKEKAQQLGITILTTIADLKAIL